MSAHTGHCPQRRELCRCGLENVWISVVIPTFNEAPNLPAVFEYLRPEYQVIVVDGHSADGSVKVARSLRPDAEIIGQNRSGKGNALACGFAVAAGDIIVTLDADGSADPREIPRFIRVLLEGADFAKGTRFVVGGGSNDITRIRRAGNRALNGLVNASYGTRYSDLCYGYNAFWRHCLPAMGLSRGEPGEPRWGDGFEVETLINVRVAQAGLRVVEVPSYEGERAYGESKLNAVRDGSRVLRTIVLERFANPRVRHRRVRLGVLAEDRHMVMDEGRVPLPHEAPTAIDLTHASLQEKQAVAL